MTSIVLPLLKLTIATSVAVLLVGLLRTSVRHVAGARAAYWLWLMVPASLLVLLLPAPSPSSGLITPAVPEPIGRVLADLLAALTAASASTRYVPIALAVWAAGTLMMLALAVRRQQAFVRSLGVLSLLPNGTYRTASAVEPMVVGIWRPRVILPADFETRYTPEERALVLAHERTHVKRGDSVVNALAAAWLCLCWFNPLMHWAIGRFRFDQELACDALVLASTGTARRRYADALLKTQLAADSLQAAPVGCNWQSTHPLKERIAALKRPMPGFMRRIFGLVLAMALITGGSYAAWAVQPCPQSGSNAATPKSCPLKSKASGAHVALAKPGH